MKSKIKLFYILLISILLISPTPVKAYDDWGGWDDWDYYDDWDDWDNDSWYDDDPYDWGAGSDDVYVYPDDNDDPYDWGLDDDWWRDAYVYDDDDDYNSWDWEEDYDDPPSSGNDNGTIEVEQPRPKVPNGDCVIGVIAAALKELGVKYDLNTIKEIIKNNLAYKEGEGIPYTSYIDALELFFNIGMFYEGDKNAIDAALDKGLPVAGTIDDEGHAVLIVDHNVINGIDYYSCYDVVTGIEFQSTDLKSYDHLHIIKSVKK